MAQELYAIRLLLERNDGGVYTVTSPDVPGLVRFWRNVQTGQVTAVPDWGSKDLAPGTVRSIVRQLGLTREQFGPIT